MLAIHLYEKSGKKKTTKKNLFRFAVAHDEKCAAVRNSSGPHLFVRQNYIIGDA